MDKSKWVFLGTPEIAAFFLEKIIEAGFRPSGVICNPDKPTGRKRIITPPPVKLVAQKYNIKVYQPEKLAPEAWEVLKKEIGEVDYFLVFAYSKILKNEVINYPRLGTIGVHPSLLPKYRGASPIQSVILNGEKETGTNIFLIDEKVDHGRILASAQCSIEDNDNYETLSEKLSGLSANLFIQTIPKYLNGELVPLEQDEAEATFTRKFTTEDGLVSYDDLAAAQESDPEKAVTIERKIRALGKEPGVFSFLPSDSGLKRVKLLEAKIRNGNLFVTKIQIEGKNPTSDVGVLSGRAL